MSAATTYALRALATAAICLVAWGAPAGAASAQPRLVANADAEPAEQARALFVAGIEAAEDGRGDDAIAAFRDSLELLPRGSTAYNLALVLDREGRVNESAEALALYFRLTEGSRADEGARYRAATQLQRRIARSAARLVLTVAPTQATLEIDGVPIEGSGAERTLWLAPGSHTIALSHQGNVNEITLPVEAGEELERELVIALTAVASAPERAPEEPPATPEPSGELGTLGYAGIGLLGLAVVSVAITAGTGVAAADLHAELVARCGPSARCPAGSEGDIASGSALAWTSTVFLGVAALSAVAGAVLLALDLTDSGEGEASAAMTLELGVASLSLRGSLD